jgi:transcriptional regulator with XRE-family HTH domain
MSNKVETTAHETDELSLADLERGQRIKQARVKASLSTSQFAEAMGLTSGAVSQWEHGRTRPNRERLKKLCELLNCSPAWIEGRTLEIGARADAARRFVPLLSMEQAALGLSWDARDIGPDNGIQVVEPCSDLAFAIKIESQHFRPALSYGAVLVVDPAPLQQPLDLVLVTLKGRPHLLQAFHHDVVATIIHKEIEDPAIEPAQRAELMEQLRIRSRQRLGWLIYRHLEDGRKADTTEMHVLGVVIQRTEGRTSPSVTRATMVHASPTMAQFLQGSFDTEDQSHNLPSSESMRGRP